VQSTFYICNSVLSP